MGILKRVIVSPAVYPHFLEFLHVGIHSIGRTIFIYGLWAHTVMTLVTQPNDVMSEIECTQLDSELFRRRHSTWQLHGLFSLGTLVLRAERQSARMSAIKNGRLGLYDKV